MKTFLELQAFVPSPGDWFAVANAAAIWLGTYVFALVSLLQRRKEAQAEERSAAAARDSSKRPAEPADGVPQV
jgi:hypothetical protein